MQSLTTESPDETPTCGRGVTGRRKTDHEARISDRSMMDVTVIQNTCSDLFMQEAVYLKLVSYYI